MANHKNIQILFLLFATLISMNQAKKTAFDMHAESDKIVQKMDRLGHNNCGKLFKKAMNQFTRVFKHNNEFAEITNHIQAEFSEESCRAVNEHGLFLVRVESEGELSKCSVIFPLHAINLFHKDNEGTPHLDKNTAKWLIEQGYTSCVETEDFVEKIDEIIEQKTVDQQLENVKQAIAKKIITNNPINREVVENTAKELNNATNFAQISDALKVKDEDGEDTWFLDIDVEGLIKAQNEADTLEDIKRKFNVEIQEHVTRKQRKVQNMINRIAKAKTRKQLEETLENTEDETSFISQLDVTNQLSELDNQEPVHLSQEEKDNFYKNLKFDGLTSGQRHPGTKVYNNIKTIKSKTGEKEYLKHYNGLGAPKECNEEQKQRLISLFNVLATREEIRSLKLYSQNIVECTVTHEKEQIFEAVIEINDDKCFLELSVNPTTQKLGFTQIQSNELQRCEEFYN